MLVVGLLEDGLWWGDERSDYRSDEWCDKWCLQWFGFHPLVFFHGIVNAAVNLPFEDHGLHGQASVLDQNVESHHGSSEKEDQRSLRPIDQSLDNTLATRGWVKRTHRCKEEEKDCVVHQVLDHLVLGIALDLVLGVEIL